MKREMRVEGLPVKTYKTGRQVVDWKAVNNVITYVVEGKWELHHYYVKILSNEMVEKVSKNGNKRKERRLDVTIDGENVYNVSTTSLKTAGFWTRAYNKVNDTCEGYDVYEIFQEQLDQPFKTERERKEKEYADARYQEANPYIFYDDVMDTYTRIKSYYEEEKMKNDLTTDFENLNIYGGIIYQSVEDKISFYDELADNHKDSNSIWDIIYYNEWRTHYRQIYLDFFTANWDEIWNNTRKQWCKYHRINEEDYFNNENKTYTSYEGSKYDYLFEDAHTVKEVKHIYRQWSKQLHPDMGGNADDFKALNAAYDNAMRYAYNDRKSTTEPTEQAEPTDDLEREFMIHVMGEALYGEMLIEQGVKCIAA